MPYRLKGKNEVERLNSPYRLKNYGEICIRNGQLVDGMC
jgi:hypothetical protein